MPAGRPSSYTPEMAEEICNRIAEGKSLRKVCEARDMPDRETVRRWINGETIGEEEGKVFAAKYARARVDRAEFHAEEIIEIADTEPDPTKARNRIAARQWYASKLDPKTYGDHKLLTSDPDRPVLVRVERVIVEDKPEQAKPLKTIDSTATETVPLATSQEQDES